MFGLRNEVAARHAQRVGADCAHRLPWQVAQAFGKTPQRGKGALLRIGIEEFVGGESGGKAHRFAQPVQHV
jgi:hypothetical protein